MKIATIIVFLILLGVSIRFYRLGLESQKMTIRRVAPIQSLAHCENDSNCFHSDLYEDKVVLVNKTTSDLLKIKDVLDKNGMTKVIVEGNYLYYTAKSTVFGFVDDVEFYLNTKENRLEFRSSSRVGHSDLGKNKSRIMAILKEFKK